MYLVVKSGKIARGPQLRRFAVVCGSLQAWGVASRCIVDVVDVALPCYRLLPLRTSPPPGPQQSEGIRLPDRRVRVVGSRVVQGGLSRRNPGTRGRCRTARTGPLALAPASCRNGGMASRHHKGAASYRHKGMASRPSRARHRATAKARQKFVSPCGPPLCATPPGGGAHAASDRTESAAAPLKQVVRSGLGGERVALHRGCGRCCPAVLPAAAPHLPTTRPPTV